MDLTLRLREEWKYKIDEVFYSGDKRSAVAVDSFNRKMAYLQQRSLLEEERCAVIANVREMLNDDPQYLGLGWFKRAEYADRIEEQELAKASAVIREYTFTDILGAELIEDAQVIMRSSRSNCDLSSLAQAQEELLKSMGTGLRCGTNSAFNLAVLVITNTLSHQYFLVDFLGCLTDKNKKIYGDAMESARRLFATCDIVVNQKDAAVVGGQNNPRGSFSSVADELQKIADLYASGILTREEFQMLKARVLEKV